MPSHAHPPQRSPQQPAPTRKPSAPAASGLQGLVTAPLTASSLLQLQRTAGNRAVNRMLNKPSASDQRTPAGRVVPAPTRMATPVIQRLPEDDVREKFDDNGFKTPSATVINLIVKLTTDFENTLGLGLVKMQAKSSLLNSLDTHLTELSFGGKPIPDDVKYWTDLVNKWIEPLDPQAQEKKKKIIQQQNLEEAMELISQYKTIEDLPEVLPSKCRVLLEVTMGQGVAADLGKTILYSDQFSTCSGVFFYNAKDFKGGLYHFAAHSYGQLPSLLAFAKRIKPTWIGIDRRVQYNTGYNTEEQNNQKATEQFMKLREALSETGAEIAEIAPAGAYYMYANEAGTKVKVDQKGAPHALKINLTDKEALPDFLAGFAGSDMIHNPDAYSKQFAKDY